MDRSVQSSGNPKEYSARVPPPNPSSRLCPSFHTATSGVHQAYDTRSRTPCPVSTQIQFQETKSIPRTLASCQTTLQAKHYLSSTIQYRPNEFSPQLVQTFWLVELSHWSSINHTQPRTTKEPPRNGPISTSQGSGALSSAHAHDSAWYVSTAKRFRLKR